MQSVTVLQYCTSNYTAVLAIIQLSLLPPYFHVAEKHCHGLQVRLYLLA